MKNGVSYIQAFHCMSTLRQLRDLDKSVSLTRVTLVLIDMDHGSK